MPQLSVRILLAYIHPKIHTKRGDLCPQDLRGEERLEIKPSERAHVPKNFSRAVLVLGSRTARPPLTSPFFLGYTTLRPETRDPSLLYSPLSNSTESSLNSTRARSAPRPFPN